MKFLNEKDLKEGEVICNKCLGVGEVLPRNAHFGTEVCSKCRGDGKLDWIANIIGKPLEIVSLRANPDYAVDLYYKGNKIFETTKDGGIKVL